LSENYLQHSEHFSRILISQDNLRNNNENLTKTNVGNHIKTETETEAETENKEAENTTIK